MAGADDASTAPDASSGDPATDPDGGAGDPATVADSGSGDQPGPVADPPAAGEAPLEREVAAARELVLVGYDAWSEPVLAELATRDVAVTVVTTRGGSAAALGERGFGVVETEDVDEACLREAGVGTADAVLVATLDDQWNVLAVLTVMNVAPDVDVVTFAGEAKDVPKLRAAGADRVISIGEAVGELLVEVALTDRDVQTVVDELVAALR